MAKQHTLRFGIGDTAVIYLGSILLAGLLLSLKATLLYAMAATTAVLWHYYSDKQHWIRMGVASPHETSIFFGNSKQLFKHGAHVFDVQNVKELGQTHGYGLFTRSASSH